MANMAKEIPSQLKFALMVVVIGTVLLGGEYFLVNWYPGHQQRARDETLQLLPYQNPGLGVDLQIAAGIYGKIESFPGGVKIYRPKFWSIGPSLTLTSQPNPDGAVEFSPQVLAKWQTAGVYQEIGRYHFEHTKINNRDAVLISQLKDRYMVMTVRVLSPDRMVEANCSPGSEDEALYLQACEESLRSMKVAGPVPPPTPTPGVQELTPQPSPSNNR